jgi:deazaflavin-dependent oxidoreductase (nitroreductase family)
VRRVDPTLPRTRLQRLLASVAGSRPATWLARRWIWSAVVWPLDRLLLRLSRGRLSTGIVLPTALLQTRGARSGLPRSNAVLYFHDGERVVIVASKAGLPGNPAWFYNARADPDVVLGGEPYRAHIVEDPAERARLWRLADRVFPGFATYRRRAGREIPILALERRRATPPDRGGL